MSSPELYVGLMSGTSMDAIDAVVVDFAQPPLTLKATYKYSIPLGLRQQLAELCQPGFDEINRLGKLDHELGKLFAVCALAAIKTARLKPQQITAIGSHGQTIRHHPETQPAFTLQIGDANIIAEETGITTVADFRRRDMAKGGQGAPLAPAFHRYLFQNKNEDRAVLNLGGIANITWLPADETAAVIGFDTGPANTLIDAWASLHLQTDYDMNGAWAAQGQCDNTLLQQMLADAYFQKQPPKSTGREYFNLKWLENYVSKTAKALKPQDIQATLCELTAITISQAIKQLAKENCKILIGGGGVYNCHLVERLKMHCAPYSIHPTAEFGLASEWVEAAAFAWFAKQTLAGKPSNLPSVTGAKDFAVLGGVYLSASPNLLQT